MTKPKKEPRARKRKATTALSSTDNPPCLVVGIGASAGGLKAFKAFFSRMPAHTCMAFVLVPHPDPTHQSLMHELLAKQTAMPVREAEQGGKVERGHVYIIPPGKYLAIKEGVLQLRKPPEARGVQTAIDHFLRSLATDRQEHAVGIILSGTGSHGTRGLKEIKLAGGLVMVQQPQSAEYDQMPCSAIDASLVDYVLPPEQMPDELVKYANHPYLLAEPSAEAKGGETPETLNRILALLQSRTRHDFRGYRKAMLMRRVQRRMGLCHIESLPTYLDHLRKQAVEVTALYKDLLIGVTGFFREPGACEVLAERILPERIERSSAVAGKERAVRVWVPGCATGEEAYSLAMLITEQFEALHEPPSIQLFASDIDEESLAVARLGIYPDTIAPDLSPRRLQRYFVRLDEHHYQVSKSLREHSVFAAQSLISDAPHSRLDLVSCRNLLIYLEPEIQQKVVSLFHFALNENGYLLLGPAESLALARPGLQTRIRAAARKAIQEGETVTDAEARVKRNGSYVPCRITVRPLTEPKEAEGLLLITFQDRPDLKGGQGAASRAAGDADLARQLEYQLKATHEDLQSTIEELESLNEELKPSMRESCR